MQDLPSYSTLTAMDGSPGPPWPDRGTSRSLNGRPSAFEVFPEAAFDGWVSKIRSDIENALHPKPKAVTPSPSLSPLPAFSLLSDQPESFGAGQKLEDGVNAASELLLLSPASAVSQEELDEGSQRDPLSISADAEISAVHDEDDSDTENIEVSDGGEHATTIDAMEIYASEIGSESASLEANGQDDSRPWIEDMLNFEHGNNDPTWFDAGQVGDDADDRMGDSSEQIEEAATDNELFPGRESSSEVVRSESAPNHQQHRQRHLDLASAVDYLFGSPTIVASTAQPTVEISLDLFRDSATPPPALHHSIFMASDEYQAEQSASPTATMETNTTSVFSVSNTEILTNRGMLTTQLDPNATDAGIESESGASKITSAHIETAGTPVPSHSPEAAAEIVGPSNSNGDWDDDGVEDNTADEDEEADVVEVTTDNEEEEQDGEVQESGEEAKPTRCLLNARQGAVIYVGDTDEEDADYDEKYAGREENGEEEEEEEEEVGDGEEEEEEGEEEEIAVTNNSSARQAIHDSAEDDGTSQSSSRQSVHFGVEDYRTDGNLLESETHDREVHDGLAQGIESGRRNESGEVESKEPDEAGHEQSGDSLADAQDNPGPVYLGNRSLPSDPLMPMSSREETATDLFDGAQSFRLESSNSPPPAAFQRAASGSMSTSEQTSEVIHIQEGTEQGGSETWPSEPKDETTSKGAASDLAVVQQSSLSIISAQGKASAERLSPGSSLSDGKAVLDKSTSEDEAPLVLQPEGNSGDADQLLITAPITSTPSRIEDTRSPVLSPKPNRPTSVDNQGSPKQSTDAEVPIGLLSAESRPVVSDSLDEGQGCATALNALTSSPSVFLSGVAQPGEWDASVPPSFALSMADARIQRSALHAANRQLEPASKALAVAAQQSPYTTSSSSPSPSPSSSPSSLNTEGQAVARPLSQKTLLSDARIPPANSLRSRSSDAFSGARTRSKGYTPIENVSNLSKTSTDEALGLTSSTSKKTPRRALYSSEHRGEIIPLSKPGFGDEVEGSRSTQAQKPLFHQHGLDGAQPVSTRHRENLQTSLITRSHCSYHKVRITDGEASFCMLSPQCTLSDRDLLAELGAEDLGPVDPSEKTVQFNDIDGNTMSDELLAKARRLVGPELFDEGIAFISAHGGAIDHTTEEASPVRGGHSPTTARKARLSLEPTPALRSTPTHRKSLRSVAADSSPTKPSGSNSRPRRASPRLAATEPSSPSRKRKRPLSGDEPQSPPRTAEPLNDTDRKRKSRWWPKLW